MFISKCEWGVFFGIISCGQGSKACKNMAASIQTTELGKRKYLLEKKILYLHHNREVLWHSSHKIFFPKRTRDEFYPPQTHFSLYSPISWHSKWNLNKASVKRYTLVSMTCPPLYQMLVNFFQMLNQQNKPPPEVSSIFDERLVVDMAERTFKKENGVWDSK